MQFKYLREGIHNARLIHGALLREWNKVEKSGEPPSYPTLRTYLNGIPSPLVTLAHEGKEALHAKHSPYILRKAPPPMDCWILDHRIFDVMVRNTMFAELAPGQAYRIWLTAAYDWGSRALVGYCFSPNPCSATINSTLRMALEQYGFPKGFYWDNGKDFKSVKTRLDEITMTDGLRRMLSQHNVAFNITAALPKHPRSKPIESYFTSWSRRFDVIWTKSYLGNRPGKCPEVSRESQKQHKDFLKGKREDSPLPSDREFIIAAMQQAHEYNESAHLESLGGRTPTEVLDEAFPPESRKPVARRALDALLLKDDERTVLAGGCVEIQRMRYEPRPESLGPLYLRQGSKVCILRDPYDLTLAVALDPETCDFIGELMLQIPVEHSSDPQTQAQIKARMRTQRAVNRAMANYIEALGMGASAFGWRTEREALLDRAALRTGTDGAASDALLVAAPGASSPKQLAPAPTRRLSPAFVSDCEPLNIDEIEFEDISRPDSPFVDDAAANFSKAETEQERKENDAVANGAN